MSFITWSIGGIIRAMSFTNAAVEDSPLAFPPPSHTTTLSNLMFEMAFAEASAAARISAGASAQAISRWISTTLIFSVPVHGVSDWAVALCAKRSGSSNLSVGQ
jgi:hypothetical protein